MKPADEPPIRQLSRLRSEMFMALAQRPSLHFANLPALGVEFGVVARVSLPDWTRSGVLASPAGPLLAISVRKIALSLDGPPETIRGRVKQLIDRGLLSTSAEGVSVANSAANAEFALHYYRGIHDLTLRFVEDMHRTTDIDVAVAKRSAVTAKHIIERGIDILLRPLDTLARPTRGWQAYLLWAALAAVAVRNITYDPVLSRRYATSIPPDDLRITMSLRRLAALTSIPYATAWRHIRELQTLGLVTRIEGDRWTVLTENLLKQAVRDTTDPPSSFALRMIRELAALGLDPAAIEPHYLLGRPPIAVLT